MVSRKIILIDEEKCDGCGLCIPSCPEGALQIVNGKAKLAKESFCDGLGACLGDCPQGALNIIEAEVDGYDEAGVVTYLKQETPELLEKHLAHLQAHASELHTHEVHKNPPREEYPNKGIKEIIRKFPEVENILNEYNIGCAPCSIGSCALKDIIEIHNLSPDEEQELMAKIAKVIYPDREVIIPMIARKHEAGPEGISYSPPIKKLVDEHVLIKRLVALIPELIDNLDVAREEGRQAVIDSVDFIRSYADKYHHAKEEEILLKYFDEDLDIIKTIYEDHETGRAHVRAVLEALDDRDKEAVSEHLNAYRELLTEHIWKEDEILYPWMDRNLSITQIGELFSKFSGKDEEFGDAPKKYEELINKLEQKFKLKEALK